MKRVRFGPVIAAGSVLGFGLGGFLDGIVFHQILQWHNMLSNRVPVTDLISAKENMVWDGYFHLAVWIVTLVGIVMLLRLARRSDVEWSGSVVIGSALMGWGLFNLLEGVTNHYALDLHNVNEYVQLTEKPIYNHALLFVGGVGFYLLGWFVVGAGIRRYGSSIHAEPGIHS